MMHSARILAAAVGAVLMAGANASAQQSPASPRPPAPRRVAARDTVAPPLSVRPPASRPLLAPSQRKPTPGTVRPMQAVPESGRLPRATRGESRSVAAPALTLSPPARTSPPSAVARSVAAPTRPSLAASAAPPSGATMRCKDGTYLFGAASDDRCSSNGGVAIVLPSARPQPPAAAPRRP